MKKLWALVGSRKRIVAALLGVVALLAFARANQGKPLVVETTPLSRADIVQKVSAAAAGEVKAHRHATLRAFSSGRVEEVLVRRGGVVKAGAPLLRFESRALEHRQAQAQALHAAAQEQLLLAEARVAHAKRDEARQRRLAANGAEASRLSEEAVALTMERRLEAGVAQARVQEAAAQVRESQAALRNARVRAPFAGVVRDLRVSVGDDVAAGTVVAEVVDPKSLYVEASLDEADMAAVQVGQPAVVRCDGLGQQPLKGTVAHLEPTVRRDTKGARTLGLEVAFAQEAVKDSGLKPGMSANVDVQVGEAANTLAVPSNLIASRHGRRSVFVLESGLLKEVQIEAGLANWEHTEVLHGLSEGAALVTSTKVKGMKDGVRAVAQAGAAS